MQAERHNSKSVTMEAAGLDLAIALVTSPESLWHACRSSHEFTSHQLTTLAHHEAASHHAALVTDTLQHTESTHVCLAKLLTRLAMPREDVPALQHKAPVRSVDTDALCTLCDSHAILCTLPTVVRAACVCVWARLACADLPAWPDTLAHMTGLSKGNALLSNGTRSGLCVGSPNRIFADSIFARERQR